MSARTSAPAFGQDMEEESTPSTDDEITLQPGEPVQKPTYVWVKANAPVVSKLAENKFMITLTYYPTHGGRSHVLKFSGYKTKAEAEGEVLIV